MVKKTRNILIVVLVLVFLLLKLTTIYSQSGMMGQPLKYGLVWIKPICFLMGGEFDGSSYGITGNQTKFFGSCLVDSKIMCKLRGGEILPQVNFDQNDPYGTSIIGISGACYKKK